jgi:hypothetical protein
VRGEYENKDLISQIERITLKPGDRLVVTVKRRAPDVEIERIFKLLQRWAGDIPIAIVDEDVKLSVVSQEGYQP